MLFKRSILLLYSALAFFTLLLAYSPSTLAASVRITFVQETNDSFAERMGERILEELKPLLPASTSVLSSKVEIAAGQSVQGVFQSLQKDPSIDILVSLAFGVSGAWYHESKFPKPTFLLYLLDPELLGAAPRERVRNLTWYSSRNEVRDVFARLRELFQADSVAVLTNSTPVGFKNMGAVLRRSGREAGVELQFVSLDMTSPLEAQIPAADAVLLPPLIASEKERRELFSLLRHKRIPSYVVLGERYVSEGALVSDTQSQDMRTLARRVALDLQSRIAGEGSGRSAVWLQQRPVTTINLNTARAIGVDFTVDELLSSRIVRDQEERQQLGFMEALAIADKRSFTLASQRSQLAIDKAALASARAERKPQISANLAYTRLGEQLPTDSSQATLSLNQVIYSAAVNASVNSAQIGLNGSFKSLDNQRLQTLANTAAAYFRALSTQAQMERQERALTLNEENYKLARKRRDSGSGTGADLYRWESIIATGKSSLIEAYTDNISAQAALLSAIDLRYPLPLALGEPESTLPPFDLLNESLAPWLDSVAKIDQLREYSVQRALLNSPELASSVATVGQAEVNLKALKRAYYTPELSLVGQASKYLDTSELASGEDLDGDNDWQLGLQVNLPLWLGGARRASIDQVSGQRDQAQYQLQAQSAQLRANVIDAVNALVANRQVIAHNETAEASATRSLEITRRAYQLGSSSVTDLLDAQNTQLDAQANTRVARYNYLAALVDYQSLSGEMPMLMPGVEQRRWITEFQQQLIASGENP
ncbi:MAG: TolC family protein [Granulosicoccaceae bacterium]